MDASKDIDAVFDYGGLVYKIVICALLINPDKRIESVEINGTVFKGEIAYNALRIMTQNPDMARMHLADLGFTGPEGDLVLEVLSGVL